MVTTLGTATGVPDEVGGLGRGRRRGAGRQALAMKIT